MIQENLFSDFKGPVIRIGAQPIPPPHSPPLVDAMIPDVDQIVDAVIRLAEGGNANLSRDDEARSIAMDSRVREIVI